MAKRKVHRRARSLLGSDPVALVWCELPGPIPKPPAAVRHEVGKVRLKARHHWLMYVLGAVFFVVVVPVLLLMTLLDSLEQRLDGKRDRDTEPSTTEEGARPPNPPFFDGDWARTAGQLLLLWYKRSPSPKRLVLLTREGVHLAASPGRRLAPTRAADFTLLTHFPASEARIEAEPNQPRGFARFRLRFADGSWLELGRLADPEDADRFFATMRA
ncbi:hypothetical protein [Streptomyces sp. SID11385]|uniref:hypothetical protein n=1 Tax=Streptomyces sp. SID11385 TaxID=2706031 RepID=UPI0013CDAE19|nr:hypothetical protein [Streptomyces sp. SID11385]NEA39570.1 hypothetical protein [Streptomyces sp. SID11385]